MCMLCADFRKLVCLSVGWRVYAWLSVHGHACVCVNTSVSVSVYLYVCAGPRERSIPCQPPTRVCFRVCIIKCASFYNEYYHVDCSVIKITCMVVHVSRHVLVRELMDISASERWNRTRYECDRLELFSTFIHCVVRPQGGAGTCARCSSSLLLRVWYAILHFSSCILHFFPFWL